MASLLWVACNNKEVSSTDENEIGQEESEGGDVATLTDVQIKTVGIAFGHVEKKPLSNVLRVNGKFQLNPQDRAEVASLMGGIVQRIVVTEGQHVVAGQVVAWLENTQLVELQKDALVASKEAAFAKQEATRQNSLRAEGAGVEKTRQQAQVEYEVAMARLQGLRQQLSQVGIDYKSLEQGKICNAAPIKSPISGTVGRIRISTGSYVDMQTPLMDIANTNAVYCDLNVYDKDIEQVALGQTVDIRHSNLAASDLEGTISQINTTLDPETKSFSVHVRLNHEDDHTLVPDMYVTAVIHTGRLLCDAVPSEAIVNSEGHSYVFVRQTGNTFVRTEIIPGSEDLGYTQISTMGDSIPTSADVVVKGAYYISSMLGDHGEED